MATAKPRLPIYFLVQVEETDSALLYYNKLSPDNLVKLKDRARDIAFFS